MSEQLFSAEEMKTLIEYIEGIRFETYIKTTFHINNYIRTPIRPINKKDISWFDSNSFSFIEW
jgi:hypothetical protein